MINSIDDICFYHAQSRKQRAEEIARGQGTKGTMSYEHRGCYERKGKNEKCVQDNVYISKKQAEEN